MSSTRSMPGAVTTRTSPPRGVSRSAFSTRLETTWSTRSASAIAGDGAFGRDRQRDAEHVRLLLVPSHGVLRDLGEVDLARVHAEVGAVHAREVEEITDEPLEPRRFDDDRCCNVLRIERAVLQRLRIAADRGERRLQLVADGEQERLLRLTCATELLGEVVERNRERRELGGTLDRHRLGARAAREASCSLGDAMHGPRDPAREQERGERGERAAHERGDEQAVDERRQARGRRSSADAEGRTAFRSTRRAAKKKSWPLSDTVPFDRLAVARARLAPRSAVHRRSSAYSRAAARDTAAASGRW